MKLSKIILSVALFISANALAQECALTVVSGCKLQDYVTAEGPTVTIKPAVGGGYTPKCLIVPHGTIVTIVGSTTHPLQGMDPLGDVQNPFFSTVGGVTAPVTKTLDAPGQYGFFCTHHGNKLGEGMAGAILVQ
jgi:plastocyanin